ncbi:hypothetical protein A6F68_00426 [Tsuneonella dongtanensis]|uniref:Uncharacterized protein n=1 Tax=Tsuneonella dongtanensis TaxID=692370 RepID=A0A1B2AA29_9SPHN|nr:hypothetical protein [Tsuneonella dongtanensis]ANY18961.1 hypothetical protein A6F68_00426 [Tsuneonella dongtanensis]
MIRQLALPLLAAAATAMAAPVAAQDEAGDKVRMLIVYGDDPVPQANGDEILVVARMPENDRFRIPEALRFSEDPANMAWARRVEKLDLIGKFGTMSCSTAGAGGFTGCTQQLIDAFYADKREGADVRFSQLIAAARAERLSTIDATSAEEQARVEQIERQYMERLERERAGALPGEPEKTPPGDAEPIMTPPQG